MDYIEWAILALAGYTAVSPLMKVATVDIPSTVAALVANSILVFATLGVVAFTDLSITPYLTHPRMVYVVAAGVGLAVGILAYYKALAMGPVSVVAPIFGLFLVTSSAIGVVVLGEDLTLRKAAGIGCAALAVYLTAGPST